MILFGLDTVSPELTETHRVRVQPHKTFSTSDVNHKNALGLHTTHTWCCLAADSGFQRVPLVFVRFSRTHWKPSENILIKIAFYSKFAKHQQGTTKSRSCTGQGDYRASMSSLGITPVQDIRISVLEALRTP